MGFCTLFSSTIKVGGLLVMFVDGAAVNAALTADAQAAAGAVNSASSGAAANADATAAAGLLLLSTDSRVSRAAHHAGALRSLLCGRGLYAGNSPSARKSQRGIYCHIIVFAHQIYYGTSLVRLFHAVCDVLLYFCLYACRYDLHIYTVGDFFKEVRILVRRWDVACLFFFYSWRGK